VYTPAFRTHAPRTHALRLSWHLLCYQEAVFQAPGKDNGMSEQEQVTERPGEVERPEGEGGKKPIALVDGSNVAHSSEGEFARLQNIRLVAEKLIEEGYEPIVVADAALRHQIDDRDGFEERVESGKIRQAPSGTDADYFILAFARELDAAIVSNDRFRDRQEAFPDALERMIRYMIVADEVVFERRNRKR